ncbi:MAG: hypothetical protein MUO63_22620 [Desulfobulbaceae bacterium]|nr:hypothetical protein [Desulfobulbaceae bacterium]
MAAQKEIIVLVHGFFRTRRDMAFAMGDRFVPLLVRRSVSAANGASPMPKARTYGTAAMTRQGAAGL